MTKRVQRKVSALFLLTVLLFSSCAAEKTKQPRSCEGLVFFERDGMPAVGVQFTSEEPSEGTAIFTADDADALCEAVLSTQDTILYKSMRYVLLDKGLSDARRREIMTALFSRTEFGLQCAVYDVTVYDAENGTSLVPNAFDGHPVGLCAYYRAIMNPNGYRKKEA